MAYEFTIQAIRGELQRVFDELDSWFEKSEALRRFKPSKGGWSIDEILEHISLTSHFLLIVIRNGATKALKRAARQPVPTIGESDLEIVQVIGQHGSFTWVRPDHMVPSGAKASAEVRAILRSQREECMEVLKKLSLGEGALFTANMSVNKLGRLDLYQWIYFLVQHARRHIAQLEAVLSESEQN